MENNSINFYDFLSTKKILHSETATNFNEGLKFFCENEKNTDIITYNHTEHFLFFNVDVLGIDDNNYFYEYTPKRNGDIIDNIRYESSLNARLSYYINDIEYTSDDVSEFIFSSAPYSKLKVRITFLEKPSTNDEFKIYFRHWIINSNDRKILRIRPVIIKNIVYKDGVCFKM